MSITVIVLAVMALALSLIAYWRTGGRDVQMVRERAQRTIVALRSRRQRIFAAAIYESARARLAATRHTLHRLAESAPTDLGRQTALAREHLEALSRRLEERVRAAQQVTLTTSRSAEETLVRSVHRIEARSLVLRAKLQASRAVTAANRQDFGKAERQLKQAAELLQAARATLARDPACASCVEDVRKTVCDAIRAVRAHTEDNRARLDRILAEADELVVNLESDERSDVATTA